MTDLTSQAVAGWAGSLVHSAERTVAERERFLRAARVLKRLRALHPEQVDELCAEQGLVIAWDQV